MPHFAPNKYVDLIGENYKHYTKYLNVPDMERVIEVSETQAEQVMRKQPQWIEVKPQEVKLEKEIKEAAKEVLVEKTTLEKVEEAFKQRGRPKVKK